jgi:hypothetical protein
MRIWFLPFCRARFALRLNGCDLLELHLVNWFAFWQEFVRKCYMIIAHFNRSQSGCQCKLCHLIMGFAFGNLTDYADVIVTRAGQVTGFRFSLKRANDVSSSNLKRINLIRNQDLTLWDPSGHLTWTSVTTFVALCNQSSNWLIEWLPVSTILIKFPGQGTSCSGTFWVHWILM